MHWAALGNKTNVLQTLIMHGGKTSLKTVNVSCASLHLSKLYYIICAYAIF